MSRIEHVAWRYGDCEGRARGKTKRAKRTVTKEGPVAKRRGSPLPRTRLLVETRRLLKRYSDGDQAVLRGEMFMRLPNT